MWVNFNGSGLSVYKCGIFLLIYLFILKYDLNFFLIVLLVCVFLFLNYKFGCFGISSFDG